MITEYLSRRPAAFFEAISAIPRASRQEERIADYLVDFAKARGLSYIRDGENNVLIKKSGTPGREQEPALLIQAHTDMVTEVAFGFAHDFSTAGVSLLQEGNILSADHTTLGADDGFGVALMLSVLDGGADSHPPVECLFTSAEEIGLIGATAFDYSHITARRMLNFDSAEEHLVITGCCGGIRTGLELPVSFVKTAGEGLEVTLTGLCGGHSGEDIHRGRGNALVLLGKILKKLEKVTPFGLVSLHGGDKDNAIPRDCTAVILPESREAALSFLQNAEPLLSEMVTAPEDGNRTLTVTPMAVDRVLSPKDTERLLTVLSLPNGILVKRPDGRPETSRNLASVRTDSAAVAFCLSSRSPFEEKIDASVSELDALAEAVEGSADHHARYPGWEGAADSAVSALWQKAYRQTTGREISATVIHAGLECGLISARLPGMDVISLGCNIYDLHTPAERMELDSLERIYQTLLAFLKEC